MNKKELQDALRETKKQLKRYRDAQVWYSGAVTALSPLRYHIHEVLTKIDDHNRTADRLNQHYGQNQLDFRGDRIEDARKAAEKCEKYFSKPIDNPQ